MCAKRRLHVVVGAAVALVALFASSARAQPPSGVNLSWSVAGDDGGCPSTEAVLANVERILGHSTAPWKKVSALARVRRDVGGAWHVTIGMKTEEGDAERKFVAGTCAEAAAATALIVAIAVDASAGVDIATDHPDADRDAGSPMPPEVDGGLVREPPASASRTGSSRRPSLSAFLGIDVARGALPETAAGGELGLALTVTPLRIEMAGATFAASQALVGNQESKGAEFHRATFALRACLITTVRGVELGACPAGGLTRVSGAAFGTARSVDGATTWGDVGACGVARWPLTRVLALRLRLGVDVPLRRPRFVVESTTGGADTTLFRPAAVGVDGSFGVEVAFF